jgi:hypothetical protein
LTFGIVEGLDYGTINTAADVDNVSVNYAPIPNPSTVQVPIPFRTGGLLALVAGVLATPSPLPAAQRGI